MSVARTTSTTSSTFVTAFTKSTTSSTFEAAFTIKPPPVANGTTKETTSAASPTQAHGSSGFKATSTTLMHKDTASKIVSQYIPPPSVRVTGLLSQYAYRFLSDNPRGDALSVPVVSGLINLQILES